jgi:hypothetical protein
MGLVPLGRSLADFCRRFAACFRRDGTRFISRGCAPNPKAAPAALLAPLAPQRLRPNFGRAALVPLGRGAAVGIVLRTALSVTAAVCGACKSGHANRAGQSTPSLSSRDGEASLSPDGSRLTSNDAEFSAPLGAVRIGSLDVVAGLVAAAGTVRLLGFTDGRQAWSADVLRGVAWAPDAELRLQGAPAGISLLWHGLRDGKSARTLVLVGARGEERGPPVEIGSSFCSTADGTAWIGPHTAGPTRVSARRWSEADSNEVLSVSADRDVSLVCGDHRVIVLEEGEDDLGATSFVPGERAAPAPVTVLRDSDFRDDEREHDAYSIGDDLGLVRVAASGSVALREVSHANSPSPWRNLEHALSAEDDVVTVDGDVGATLIVVTHESEDACGDSRSSSESVRAIRIDRKTGQESLVEVAAPDCNRVRGPYWIGQASSGTVVAWIERHAAAPPKSAPISGMAFRVLGGADTHAAERIEELADAWVNGGCDDLRCSAAALLREPGSDGMRPAPIRVLLYP